jgi:Tfp pilus assembly protein PilF
VALLKLGRVDDAIAAFEEALKRDVEYAPAHVNIAIAYSRLGQYELALVSLDNAEQFGAPVFDVMSNRGTVLAKLERYDEAAEVFARALDERPGYLTVRFERAMALAKAGIADEAIRELERITTLQPAFTPAYLEKARLLAAVGRLTASMGQYDVYLGRVPKDAVAWNELGNIRFAFGEYALAETCFRKAIKYRKDFYDAYLNLSATLERLGRARDAARYRRKAERYKPPEEDEGQEN